MIWCGALKWEPVLDNSGDPESNHQDTASEGRGPHISGPVPGACEVN